MHLVGDGAADFFGRHLLLELYDEVAAASEVDAFRQAAHAERDKADGEEDSEDGERTAVERHELHIRVFEEATREFRVELQVQPLVFVHEVFVDDARHPYGGEERGADTDDQSRSKASDGTCTEVE